MAIEIPGLSADRLPHPEWGPATALERFALPAARLLAALEGTGAPAGVLDSLATATAQGATADVLLAPDRGVLQILLDGRRVPLAGAARAAVLTLLGRADLPAAPAAAAAGATQLADAYLAARVAAIGAQVREARAQAGAMPAGPAPAQTTPPAITVPQALLDAGGTGDAAHALARAAEASGLFLEAHVAQWLRGERSLGQLQEEARALPSDGSATEGRAGAQTQALQQQALQIDGWAWPGQALQLVIQGDRERNPEAANAGEPTGLFEATLRLHLPRLGALQARIRVLHDTVGVQLAADRAPPFAQSLPDLASALAARGLTLAALDVAPEAPSAESLR